MDRLGFLRAQKADLGRLIASSDPDDVSRIGFESRLADVEEEILAHGAARGRIAEVTILFRGAPVIGTRAIEAVFAGRAVEGFQKLVSKVAASKRGRKLGERGPIPGTADSRLFLTDTAPGSFGLVLREMAEQRPLLGESPLASAVDATTDLLAKAAANDDDFADAAVETDPGVLDQLDEFLSIVGDRGATLRVITSERSAVLDDAETLSAARERTHHRRIEERDAPEHGVLGGVLPFKRLFELNMNDGSVISGVIDPHVDAAAALALAGQRVVARLRVVTIARRGRETTRYVLKEVTPELP